MKFLTNLLFEPKGKHDPALAYNIKDTVMSADGSRVYFALQDVPAGIALDNEDYWKLQIDLSSSKSAMDQALASFGNYAKEIGTRVRGETAKASGNPVTFLPDAGSLIQPVTVLEVQQQGSGDPYPAGGGRNLLNYDMWQYVGVHNGTGVYENNGVTLTANNDDAYTIDALGWPDKDSYLAKIPVNPGESITLSWEADRSYSANIYIFPNADLEGLVVCNNTENRPLVYTATDGVSFVTIRFSATKAGDVVSYRNIMVNKGTQALPFEPYSNIRPIVGYDALDLTATGKNLLPNLATDGFYGGVSLTRNPDGTMYVKGNCVEEHVIPIWGNGYDRAIDIDDCWVTSRPGFGLKVIKADGSEAYYSYDAFYLAPGDSIVWAYFHFHPGEVWDGLVEPQIELGNQRTSYEPYQGNNYTVQIGQTVYGGKFDWLTGKLTAEWMYVGFDGSDILWAANNGGTDTLFYLVTHEHNIIPAAKMGGRCICTHAPTKDAPPVDQIGCCVSATSSSGIIYLNLGVQTGAYGFNQYVAENDVRIAYELAEPIEIQLTPHTITAADPEQTNTLYGDGRIDVEYVKPLHVSIEERVAAAVAAAMNAEGV